MIVVVAVGAGQVCASVTTGGITVAAEEADAVPVIDTAEATPTTGEAVISSVL